MNIIQTKLIICPHAFTGTIYAVHWKTILSD